MAKHARSRRLETTAAAVGNSLGTVAAKVDHLNKQRQALAAELRHVISTAQDMLAELGDEAVVIHRRAKRVTRRLSRRRKNRLSPQGRANIIAAAKKRWAKARKG